MTAIGPEAGGHSVEVERHGTERRMEGLIETVATGLGNTVGWLAESGVLFAMFAILWVAFAVGLVWSQGSLDQAWEAIRSQPLVVQLLVWVLFLPVMVGLWVWETSWPLLVRVVVVLGVAGWNLLVLLPRALQAKP
jgi:ABC-type amino acid transport system permease subunit